MITSMVTHHPKLLKSGKTCRLQLNKEFDTSAAQLVGVFFLSRTNVTLSILVYFFPIYLCHSICNFCIVLSSLFNLALPSYVICNKYLLQTFTLVFGHTQSVYEEICGGKGKSLSVFFGLY